ncbi:MAG: flagellar biosynthesis protein FlhB [Thermanaerothrix sp.]|nr:flagellar biosynthesis protein FlhB [Thermanaerothrix sp.]
MEPEVLKRGWIPSMDVDIQFFAEEKSEPATPRKRQKAREEGQVTKSQDLTAAVVIASGLIGVLLFGGFFMDNLTRLFEVTMGYLKEPSMGTQRWLLFPVLRSLSSYFLVWLPLGLICALSALGLLAYQVGFLFTSKPLIPNFNRLNPVSGMKKMFSGRSFVEMLKGVVKAGILIFMLYGALKKDLVVLVEAVEHPFMEGLGTVMGRVWALSMKMTLMLLVLGLFDYAYQRWEFERSIRMSKQEIKEEYKQMEGDPLIKRRIRQRQRELAQRRMMSDVPKADVVITNPVHVAVALNYDRKVSDAPVLLAKGQGLIAERIKEIARENRVPVVQNPPLARAVYSQVEIGEEIPEGLYKAVAEVLAFVYRLKGRRG